MNLVIIWKIALPTYTYFRNLLLTRSLLRRESNQSLKQLDKGRKYSSYLNTDWGYKILISSLTGSMINDTSSVDRTNIGHKSQFLSAAVVISFPFLRLFLVCLWKNLWKVRKCMGMTYIRSLNRLRDFYRDSCYSHTFFEICSINVLKYFRNGIDEAWWLIRVMLIK